MFKGSKKIIALSAFRQLGLITVSIGLSSLAFIFHLLPHALFKAVLFMCAVAVIHSMGDSPDIRFMGVLSIYIPFTLHSTHEGGKVVSRAHRPPLPPGNIPGTHFY